MDTIRRQNFYGPRESQRPAMTNRGWQPAMIRKARSGGLANIQRSCSPRKLQKLHRAAFVRRCHGLRSGSQARSSKCSPVHQMQQWVLAYLPILRNPPMRCARCSPNLAAATGRERSLRWPRTRTPFGTSRPSIGLTTKVAPPFGGTEPISI